jgi:L-rhamnose mutarotase
MCIKEEVLKMMREIRKLYLPSSERIVKETFSKLGYVTDKFTPQQAEEKFEEMLNQVWIETLEVLEEYESKAYSTGIPSQLISRENDAFTKAERTASESSFKLALIEIFQRWYPHLREMFLSISQSRKARGGRDFELQFGGMLDLIGVPYQKLKRTYRVDFMIPNDDTFKRNPTSAAIASAKRTLRERWREVVEELYDMRSPNIFLVTADYDVSKSHVKAICKDHRIHLVVWNRVKKKYPNEPLVLSYNQWANERLKILMKFWES